jgi:putative peptide zinc metalloprotease protein
MLVSAAGILAEVFIASLAMIVWAAAEPGVVRATAYYVCLIAGVSTVLFNGNPLLRYDGYYFLADLLEIPNLASRASAQLGYLLRRFVLGMRDAPSAAATSAEARWLVLYGVGSFVYRQAVLLVIIAMVAAWSKPLALGLGLWWLVGQLVYPAARAAMRLARESRARASRGRALAGGAAAALAVVATLSAPLPLTTSAEGVMWLPENGEVRAGTNGSLGEWLVAPGSSVRAGQLLAELDDASVEVALAVADSDVRSAEARYLAARATDAVDAGSMLAQWQHAQAQYAAALERNESRAVTSPADGTLVVANPEDLPGRYFHQGDVIGYVVPAGGGTVLAVVPQDDIGLIRAGVDGVQVRLADSPARAHRASIARVTPAGEFDLPSAALGTMGGGALPVAPDDASGRQSLTRVFRVELAIERPFERLGGRAFVRFHHGNEALVVRLYRRSRQLFLRHLDA